MATLVRTCCAAGAISMARALKENQTIHFLDLSRNNLRAEGLEAIAKAIDAKQNPVVRRVACVCVWGGIARGAG